MRLKVLLLLSALLAGCATSTGPDGGQGLTRAQGLGGGATISLPLHWLLRSNPIPIPGASNYRLSLGDTEVAITGLASEDKPVMTEDELKALLQRSAEIYRPSAAGEPVFASLSDANKVGVSATLNAKPDAAFRVIGYGTHKTVTTAIVNTHGWVYSISIASNDPGGKTYQRAVSALASIR